jgi:hypothetical protein
MSLRPQQNIAAAQVGRYGTHATFSSYVLPGPRAKRGPAFSLPHAAVLGPIGFSAYAYRCALPQHAPPGGEGAGESAQRFI